MKTHLAAFALALPAVPALAATACAANTDVEPVEQLGSETTAIIIPPPSPCLSIPADATWDANAATYQDFASSAASYAARTSCPSFVLDAKNVTQATAMVNATPLVTPAPTTPAECEALNAHRRLWGYRAPSVSPCEGLPGCRPHVIPGGWTLLQEETTAMTWSPEGACAFWTIDPYLPLGYDALRITTEAYEVEADQSRLPRDVELRCYASDFLP